MYGPAATPGHRREHPAGDRQSADHLRTGIPSVRVFDVPRLRHDSDCVAGHPDDADAGLAWRRHVSLRQAVAPDLLRLRADRVLRIAVARDWRVVQQPDHEPGAPPRQYPRRALPGAGLPTPRRTVEPVRAAGYLVDPGQLALLDAPGLRDARQGRLPGHRRIWPHRECGVRTAGPDLRAVLHRPEARLAVLVLVQGVHPILVHSGRRPRVPDDLRALHL